MTIYLRIREVIGNDIPQVAISNSVFASEIQKFRYVLIHYTLLQSFN